MRDLKLPHVGANVPVRQSRGEPESYWRSPSGATMSGSRLLITLAVSPWRHWVTPRRIPGGQAMSPAATRVGPVTPATRAGGAGGADDGGRSTAAALVPPEPEPQPAAATSTANPTAGRR